jgi:ribosomal protein S12 methylthiotransferase accessory factor
MMQMVTQFPGGARVDTSFGPHVVRTDQPLHAGGQGSAPTPFATFLASIGACAGAFVVAFCQKRGLPTEDIRIVQTMDVDRTTGMVTDIHLDIQLAPGFPEKYREPLIRAVDQCTIKKHLEAPPRIAVTTQTEVRRTG